MVTFIVGCALGAILTKVATISVLWVASIVKLLLLAWLYTPSALEAPTA